MASKKYSKALMERICARVSAGESLTGVCQDEDMPNSSTFWRWLRDPNRIYDALRAQYLQAVDFRFLKLEDEIIDIADDGSNDWMDKQVRKGTIRVIDQECVRRSEIRITARERALERFATKRTRDLPPPPRKIVFVIEDKPIEEPLDDAPIEIKKGDLTQ